MQTDCSFPIIEYIATDSSYDRGFKHGQRFKIAIKELVDIRLKLMLDKSPHLKNSLDELALAQATISRSFDEELFNELKGIAEGAELSLTELVVLNNYTDFRDIELPEEGCSTIHVQKNENVIAGQTWDMHKSAKNYMCLIKIPPTHHTPAQLVLSLVGCLGLMGYNQHGLMIGVNNINTKNAKSGLIWPLLVRSLLKQKDFLSAEQMLKVAPVTSGHNYLVSYYSKFQKRGAHFEVGPTYFEQVSTVEENDGHAFHTNHCLGPLNQSIELEQAVNSTTHVRYQLIDKKISKIKALPDLIDLLRDHENYPKSICSHFESGAQDPSFTCAGGAVDLKHNEGLFWRGCKFHDSNYKHYKFKLIHGVFELFP